MKYVIIENRGHEVAIVFDEILDHCSVVDPGDYRLKSAGFCLVGDDLNPNSVCCYGQSITLKLKSRSEDTEIVRKSIARRI